MINKLYEQVFHNSTTEGVISCWSWSDFINFLTLSLKVGYSENYKGC